MVCVYVENFQQDPKILYTISTSKVIKRHSIIFSRSVGGEGVFIFSYKFKVANMSLVMRKLAFCICENKEADHLRGFREADQRLLFSLHG